MTDPRVRWCVTHDREAKHHFTAAVCPNDVGCQVVIREEPPPVDGRYVCAHCGKPSSMQGHYVRLNETGDGEDAWGFHCDPANNGKTYGSGSWKRTIRAPLIRRVGEQSDERTAR